MQVQNHFTCKLKKLLSIFSQGCRVETQWGSYITISVLGFVAAAVGSERLKKSVCAIDNTPVPPSIQFDSVPLSASESQGVFAWGRIEK